MDKKNFQLMTVLAALVVTATHFVRAADGRFLFSDRLDSEFVRVTNTKTSPMRFKFSRCKTDGDCIMVGKKDGYTLEDIRVQVFKLEIKREKGRLSTSESRDLEILNGMITGIEQPKPHFPSWTYSHTFKSTAEQFVKVVDDRLGAK